MVADQAFFRSRFVLIFDDGFKDPFSQLCSLTHPGMTMDRERQTLELLQLLGDDVAESVLTRLHPERADKLRSGLKADARRPSTMRRQREVLDEFECFFQFAMKAQHGEPAESWTTDASGARPFGRSAATGDSEIRNHSRESAGPASSQPIPAAPELLPPVHPADSPALSETEFPAASPEQERLMATQSASRPSHTGDPLLDLQTLSSHQLSQALASEQSRTSAILLSNLPPQMAGDVLSRLKPEYQNAVMKELTKEQHAPAVLVERIARATFARALQLPAEAPDIRDHADRVADVLRSVPKVVRRKMLAAIEEQDPELAKSLLTRIYRFEDVAGLGKTVIQRILGEVDSTNLTTALYGAPQEISDAIFVNLSKRARQTIEEEMQFMTNVAESRILQARMSIAEIMARIDMESES